MRCRQACRRAEDLEGTWLEPRARNGPDRCAPAFSRRTRGASFGRSRTATRSPFAHWKSVWVNDFGRRFERAIPTSRAACRAWCSRRRSGPSCSSTLRTVTPCVAREHASRAIAASGQSRVRSAKSRVGMGEYPSHDQRTSTKRKRRVNVVARPRGEPRAVEEKSSGCSSSRCVGSRTVTRIELAFRREGHGGSRTANPWAGVGTASVRGRGLGSHRRSARPFRGNPKRPLLARAPGGRRQTQPANGRSLFTEWSAPRLGLRRGGVERVEPRGDASVGVDRVASETRHDCEARSADEARWVRSFRASSRRDGSKRSIAKAAIACSSGGREPRGLHDCTAMVTMKARRVRTRWPRRSCA